MGAFPCVMLSAEPETSPGKGPLSAQPPIPFDEPRAASVSVAQKVTRESVPTNSRLRSWREARGHQDARDADPPRSSPSRNRVSCRIVPEEDRGAGHVGVRCCRARLVSGTFAPFTAIVETGAGSVPVTSTDA